MEYENEFLRIAMNTRNRIIDFGISERVLSTFDRHVQLIADYLNYNEIDFDLENGNKLIYGYTDGKSKSFFDSARRTVMLIYDYKHGNLNEYKVYKNTKKFNLKTTDFINLHARYQDFIKKEGYSNYTIRNLLKYARYFLVHLEGASKTNIKTLDHSDIAVYFASSHFSNRKPLGVKTESSAVRTFLKFLSDEQISDCQTLCFAVPRTDVKHEKIITVISDQAEEQLLSDYPNLPTNKRTKAMSLLALRLGLRTKDVFDLKFENINWENSLLEIKLSKNGKYVKRKIDNETLNALMDYILVERRDAETTHIFTTSRGPKKKINIKVLPTSQYRISGLDLNTHIPNQGLHILRRTFATKLLNDGAPLSVISAALGHVGKSQVDHYLSVDEKKMRSCALSLASIEFGRSEF